MHVGRNDFAHASGRFTLARASRNKKHRERHKERAGELTRARARECVRMGESERD